ncbi:hypothetical protein B0H17DRAFT_1138980 [Mycena rosella]|uniref:Uncharacterized protein n=1 Tax=Mycena rosella TaxID=1033263 RepID=A0AAD7GDN6_MYCRO|nr:hypothetical protein B0H17DRAFT_1138980 [Mycena rosella]
MAYLPEHKYIRVEELLVVGFGVAQWAEGRASEGVGAMGWWHTCCGIGQGILSVRRSVFRTGRRTDEEIEGGRWESDRSSGDGGAAEEEALVEGGEVMNKEDEGRRGDDYALSHVEGETLQDCPPSEPGTLVKIEELDSDDNNDGRGECSSDQEEDMVEVMDSSILEE